MTMKLTEILNPAAVRVPLVSRDKRGIIGELVDLLVGLGQVDNRDELFRCVMERENTRSTGIGHGLAVPHGKSPSCNRLMMAVGKPVEPVDFDSKDGKPVNFIVLLVSPPDQTGPHIQALARVSRLMLMEDFRSELARADSANRVFEIIRQFEK